MAQKTQNRRHFFKTCASFASLVAANPILLASQNLSATNYARTQLVDQSNKPITSDSLTSASYHIFNYPFVTTPCFLIDLGKPIQPQPNLITADDSSYQWPGGIGPGNSVVAFAAICTHKLSYPTRSTSFINYQPETVTYYNDQQIAKNKAQLIYCCSERSAYDPAKGAAVLGGPAPQPLTAILLEHDAENDHYYAKATVGGELYDRFFKNFGFRLALDFKNDNIRQLVEDTSIVYSAKEYSENQMKC